MKSRIFGIKGCDPFILSILLSLRPFENWLQANGVKVCQNAQVDITQPHPVFQAIQVKRVYVTDGHRKDHDLTFNYDVGKGHVAYHNVLVNRLTQMTVLRWATGN